MIEFFDTESNLERGQILEINSLIKITLPEEYINHLLNYNGGRCKPNMFEVKQNEVTTLARVDWFLAIYDGKYDNLFEYIEIYKIEKKRLPLHILPIAHDDFGNLICISCGLDDFGVIYFWDHEEEVDYEIEDDSNYSNLYKVAVNISAFINNLFEKTA